MADYSDDLRLAHVMADAADDVATRRFRALDLTVETKPDLTPVTDADRMVEDTLRNTLKRARPRDAVHGEEFGRTGYGPRCWVIDPIDATKNYVRGVPIWATLIALMEGDDVVVGLVSAPALNRRWWAARGGGAWTGRSLAKATRCRVSGVSELHDASFSYSSLHGWEERRPPGRLPRPHPFRLAHPRVRRLLVPRDGRRGRRRRLGRARGVPVGRRGRPDHRRGGRRRLHRPVRRAQPRPRQRRVHATGCCTRRSSRGRLGIRLSATGPNKIYLRIRNTRRVRARSRSGVHGTEKIVGRTGTIVIGVIVALIAFLLLPGWLKLLGVVLLVGVPAAGYLMLDPQAAAPPARTGPQAPRLSRLSRPAAYEYRGMRRGTARPPSRQVDRITRAEPRPRRRGRRPPSPARPGSDLPG